MVAPAPEWITPQNTVFDRTVAIAPAWKVPGDQSITSTEVQYVLAAAPTTWITTGLGAVSAYNQMPAASGGYQWASVTLAGGSVTSNQTIVFRVRYTSTGFGGPETSAYSYLGMFAGSVPASPTFTAPAAAATVNRLVTVTWTTPENQYQYEIEVRTATGGGGTVVYSGNGITSTKSHVVTMDITAVNRYIRIRYAREAQAPGLTPLWSAWVERQVTTAFINPATPTFTTSLIDPLERLGFNHVVEFTITNPAPTGGQPTVTDMAIEYRKKGSGGNLLSANDASFETSVGWGVGGQVPTLSQSAVRSFDGSKSMLAAWSAVSSDSQARLNVTGLVVGLTYTVSAYVYVPTGSPNVTLQAAALGNVLSAAMTTKDAWTRIVITAVATATNGLLIFRPTATNGQAWIDAVMLEQSDTASPFSAAPGDPWVFIDTSIGMVAPYRWRAPAGSWEFRVTAYASAAGTQATSDPGQPQTVALKGVILELPTVPATYPSPMWLQYNDSGADEAYEVESALVQYQGRTYPVVEYGATKSNVIEVGKVTLLSRAEYDRLLAFVDVKTPVLYRDAKGRRVYGTINIGTIHDRSFGHELGFTIARIDYTNPIEVGQV